MTYQFRTLCASIALFAMGTFAAGAATVTATVYAGEPGYGTALGTGQSWYPDFEPSVVDGTVPNNYVSPLGDDTTDYYTVGSPNLAGSPAALDLGTTVNDFSFLWGTVDDYNMVGLFSDPYTLVDYVTGDEILALLGVVSGGTGAIVDISSVFDFQYVAFYSNFTGSFDEYGNPILSDSDTPAFEFALAPVPVPAAGLLLLGGLGALGALRRRKAA